MIISPIVYRIRGDRYKPLILRQIEKNGCVYFHSIEPIRDTWLREMTSKDSDRAINMAYNAVKKINVIV
jgi:hypothetical protein